MGEPAWWLTPAILALGRWIRKMGGWGWAELKVSLGYIARLSEMKENIG